MPRKEELPPSKRMVELNKEFLKDNPNVQSESSEKKLAAMFTFFIKKIAKLEDEIYK